MGNRHGRAPIRRYRSATNVVDGVVRPKNRHAPTVLAPGELILARERAGRGWQHVLGASDVRRFLEIVPDWSALAIGLHTIRLAAGSYTFGYYRPGLVAVCAMPADRRVASCYLDKWARRLLRVLDARTELGECPGCKERVQVYALSREQVRAWQLLDVLHHELGHHHDAMSNRGGRVERAEHYALCFAEERWKALWDRYQRTFAI